MTPLGLGSVSLGRPKPLCVTTMGPPRSQAPRRGPQTFAVRVEQVVANTSKSFCPVERAEPRTQRPSGARLAKPIGPPLLMSFDRPGHSSPVAKGPTVADRAKALETTVPAVKVASPDKETPLGGIAVLRDNVVAAALVGRRPKLITVVDSGRMPRPRGETVLRDMAQRVGGLKLHVLPSPRCGSGQRRSPSIS